jgi:hypothetical protein
VPARGEMRLGIYVQMPEHCQEPGEKLSWQEGGTHIERWSARCPGGIVGHRIEISGLSSTVTALPRWNGSRPPSPVSWPATRNPCGKSP